MSISRNWLYAIGLFVIAFILGTMLVLPIFDDRRGLDILLGIGKEEPVEPTGADELEAYHYWYAPVNSFGISSTKTVNWSYFKSLFLAHTDWILEYKRYEYSDWTDGSDYLTIERIWNDTGFWKFNLIFDVPVHIYSARFTFGIDLSCLQYVEREGYEVWINYTANATETYSCMFNWSDIANIPGLVITKGIQDGMFWFRFKRDDIPAGHYEFDPTFGSTGDSNDIFISTAGGGELLRGLFASPSSSGTADKITIEFASVGAAYDYQCALYEYTDYGTNWAGALIAVTETKEVSAADTAIDFNFSAPKPSVTDGVNYYICIRITESSSHDNKLKGISQAGSGIFDSDTSPIPFNDPLIGEASSSNVPSLLCSYTVGAPANNAPTQTGESPSNQSTGLNLAPDLYIKCIDNDSSDEMNATWWSNSSSSWVLFASNETSFANNTNITQSFTNATTYSTTFYWSVNLTDGTDWRNETYHFTTKTPIWHTIDSTINGSIYNISRWNVIDNIINGSIYNSTTWKIIDAAINGSIYNVSRWNIIDNAINGSIYNTSYWYLIDNNINGSIYNLTSWNIIDDTINGSIYNLSSWRTIDNTINGSIYNLTTWKTIDNTINGSIYNISGWYVIDNTINGSIYNISLWNIIDSTINGSIYNLTTWKIIDSTINGSIYNISVANITISNPYPADESVNIPVNVTLHITINHTMGYTMNLTWYTGNSTANCTHYLGSHLDVNNGTYYIGYHNASNLSTIYYWRVNVSDGKGNYTQETYNFTTALTTGMYVATPRRYSMGMVMAMSMLLGILFVTTSVIWIKKRRR